MSNRGTDDRLDCTALGRAGAILASLTTPAPGRSVLELVREIRVPGGEVIYDREMRLLRLKNRERT